MHRSMKEDEPAHKTDSPKFESHTRGKEEHHGAVASQLHAHEKATVPDGAEPTHTAVKHSVGRYMEKDGAHERKTLRRHRS